MMLYATPYLWAKATLDAARDTSDQVASLSGAKAPAVTAPALSVNTLAGKGLFGSIFPTPAQKPPMLHVDPVINGPTLAPASSSPASSSSCGCSSSSGALPAGVAANVAAETLLTSAATVAEQVPPVSSHDVPRWAWWLFAVLAGLAIFNGGRK